jgi:hypothetical protein
MTPSLTVGLLPHAYELRKRKTAQQNRLGRNRKYCSDQFLAYLKLLNASGSVS